MDRGADAWVANTKPPFEQGLRAEGADQRDVHQGGDDPPDTEAAGEERVNLTKQALSRLPAGLFALCGSGSFSEFAQVIPQGVDAYCQHDPSLPEPHAQGYSSSPGYPSKSQTRGIPLMLAAGTSLGGGQAAR